MMGGVWEYRCHAAYVGYTGYLVWYSNDVGFTLDTYGCLTTFATPSVTQPTVPNDVPTIILLMSPGVLYPRLRFPKVQDWPEFHTY